MSNSSGQPNSSNQPNLWKKIKDNFPTTLVLSVFAWLFGLYSGYQVELREDEKAQNLNDQRMVEGYFNIFREVRLNQDYNNPDPREIDFIHNLTLVTLREISTGSDRKAAIVLLLNKLQIPKKIINSDSDFAFYKGADLKFTDFTGYEFRDAKLSKADLRGAIFHKAVLKKSRLISAELTCGDKLRNDNWGWIPFWGKREVEEKQCVDLTKAKLEGSNLSFAKLSGADLSEAKLRPGITGIKFQGDNLSNVLLSAANLTGADLTDVNLTKANLSANIDLQDLNAVNLSQSDYEKLNLKGADLTEANLTNANLSDADLTSAKLVGTNFNGTIVKNTKFGNNSGISETAKEDLIRRGAIFTD